MPPGGAQQVLSEAHRPRSRAQAGVRPGGSGWRRWILKRHLHNWAWVAPLVLLALVRGHRHFELPSEDTDALTDAAGGLLLAAGIFIRLCARGWKYETPGRGMVTGGPYGYVRHPLYLGSFLMGVGLCLILGVPWFAAVYTVCFWAAHLPVIRLEERNLSRLWPAAYAAYVECVPALAPSLRTLKCGGRFLPRGWGAALRKEADSVCLWPLAAIAIELAEDAGSPSMLSHHLTEVRALLLLALTVALTWAFLKTRRTAVPA